MCSDLSQTILIFMILLTVIIISRLHCNGVFQAIDFDTYKRMISLCVVFINGCFTLFSGCIILLYPVNNYFGFLT